MGASSSIVTEGIPDDIKALVDVIEGQKCRIAEYDANLLEKESSKMFKGHNVIIDELTARTKGQIRRMLEMYPNSGKQLDQLVEGGNSYAKFIKQLAVPRDKIELEMVSRPDVEYDEETLVEIIGTSSVKEIKAFDEKYTALKSYSLLDAFTAHSKKESTLLKFLERILRLDRDESKNVDKDQATKQAEIIHRSGAARLIGVDEDPIFEIFASSSRFQCACIAETYLDMYNMKLERAINMKFKGNCGKLIVLWTQTIPHSIVSVLGFMTSKMLVDNAFVSLFLAKFDKDILASVDEACVAVNKKSVPEFIKGGVLSSSTLTRACKGWIEAPSPDKGFEKILQLFVESKFPDGKIVIASEEGSPVNRKSSQSDLRKNSTSDLNSPTKALDVNAQLAQKFKFLLEKQGQEIKLFMIDRKIKIDPKDQQILSRNSTQASTVMSRTNTDRTERSSENGRNASENGKNSSIASFSKKNQELTVCTSVDGEEGEDTLTPLPQKSPTRGRKNSDLSRVAETEEDSEKQPKNRSTVFGSNYSVPKQKDPEVKDRESKVVYNYLLEYFESRDTENEGSFDGPDFWGLVRSLPLEEFGMNDDDIDTVRMYCSWENDDDGRVYYYEVLFEFAESVMTAIENKPHGEKDITRVIQSLSPSAEEKAPTPTKASVRINATKDIGPLGRQSSSVTRQMSGVTSNPSSPRFEKRKMTTVSKYPKIPLYVREYVLDTLQAFDFDLSETLSRNEVESLVPTLNIPTLTIDEFFKKTVILSFLKVVCLRLTFDFIHRRTRLLRKKLLMLLVPISIIISATGKIIM
jgi:hypothetical protein